MNIIIFFEHIGRELYGCQKVSEYLIDKYDYKVSIYSIIFEYYDALSYAKENGIDLVVMPWMYSKRDYELVAPFIEINNDLVIINLHHEQIYSSISKDIIIPKNSYCKNNVIHFVWGENFKNELIKSGVDKDLIYVTGNIRTDIVLDKFDKKNSRLKYSEEFNLDTNKKWLLYSENRDWIWGNKENLLKVYTEAGCTEKDFEYFYRETATSLETTINDIKDLPDAFFDLFELIYRPHPGTTIQNSFDNRIKVISKYGIYDWLGVVDANIVSGSTTIFESDMLKVPSFVDSGYEIPEKFRTVGINKYPKINSLTEISNDSINETKMSLDFKKTYEYYLGSVDGKSGERTARIIDSILKHGNEKYIARKIPYNKLKFRLKYFREKAIRLIVCLNLLEILKRPRIAYRLKNDIPYVKRK
jgi:hypothetical protein